MVLIGKTDVKRRPTYLVLCYDTIKKGKLTVGKVGLKMRLFKKLLKLENTPRSYAKPLRSPLDGIWEIYFEKRWRILFEIDEENKLIKIVAFKHKDEMK